MKKSVIILLHLLLPRYGLIEHCLSRGLRKLRCNLGYHYSSTIQYRHPAYQDISITTAARPHTPLMEAYMLCKKEPAAIPQFITFTLPLN